MTVPTTAWEAERDGWSDDPLQCIECGGWFDPSDGEWKRTEFGPVCGLCVERMEPSEIEAAA